MGMRTFYFYLPPYGDMGCVRVDFARDFHICPNTSGVFRRGRSASIAFPSSDFQFAPDWATRHAFPRSGNSHPPFRLRPIASRNQYTPRPQPLLAHKPRESSPLIGSETAIGYEISSEFEAISASSHLFLLRSSFLWGSNPGVGVILC